MAQNMVGIREEAKTILRKLAKRKRVSQQGLLSALVLMANGDSEELGIIDLDWDAIRKRYPNQKNIQKRSWSAVLKAVKVLLEETDDPEEMAMRSRFTLAQCKRAIKELTDED